uniref:Uncharacterized protein n=1 Tax=Anguilla anguilla TaxID=7936 RepID=A0A0E9SAW8_ANGAN
MFLFPFTAPFVNAVSLTLHITHNTNCARN